METHCPNCPHLSSTPKGNNLDIGNPLETSEALKVKDAAVGVSIPRAKGAESAAGAAKIDVDMATVDKAGKLQKLLVLDAKENRLTHKALSNMPRNSRHPTHSL